jgi:hypothetical protein
MQMLEIREASRSCKLLEQKLIWSAHFCAGNLTIIGQHSRKSVEVVKHKPHERGGGFHNDPHESYEQVTPHPPLPSPASRSAKPSFFLPFMPHAVLRNCRCFCSPCLLSLALTFSCSPSSGKLANAQKIMAKLSFEFGLMQKNRRSRYPSPGSSFRIDSDAPLGCTLRFFFPWVCRWSICSRCNVV